MLCELSSAIADTLARYQHCFGHIPKTQHRTGSSERSQLHPSQTQYKCTNTLLNHLRTQTNACCIPQIQYEFQDPCSIEPVSLFILLCGSSRITSPSPDQSGRFLRATSALPLWLISQPVLRQTIRMFLLARFSTQSALFHSAAFSSTNYFSFLTQGVHSFHKEFL